MLSPGAVSEWWEILLIVEFEKLISVWKCLLIKTEKYTSVISTGIRQLVTLNQKRKRQPNRIRLKDRNISVLRDINRQKVSRTNPSFRKEFTD